MKIKLYRKDTSGCSVEGVNYEPDGDGAFLVSPEHVPQLVEMGFTSENPLPPENPRKSHPALMTTEALQDEAAELEIPNFGTLERGPLVGAVAKARKAKIAAEVAAADAAEADRLKAVDAESGLVQDAPKAPGASELPNLQSDQPEGGSTPVLASAGQDGADALKTEV